MKRTLSRAKPSDLPVEQPTSFKLMLKLGTANALGVILPSALLAPPDEALD